MATMFLYRLAEYIPTDTIPTLPIVSFENYIELKNVPTFPMDELERIWKEKKQIVFMMHHLDEMDVYYFLLPTDYPDTAEYWHHELSNQTLKWHHCDFYTSRILERFLERFQRRLHTRTLLSEIHQHIQHELNITDETEPHFQESLYETLCTIHLDDSHDRHLIQSVREEAREKVETERRFRPDGDGYHEAKRDFEQSVDHHRF